MPVLYPGDLSNPGTYLLFLPHWHVGSLPLGPSGKPNTLLQQVAAALQSLSHVQLFASPWTAAHQASLSFTISPSLLKLMSIESVMPFNHLILCRPFSFCPQSCPASGSFPMSRLFTSGGQSIGVSVSTSVLPMNIRVDFL